MLARTHTITHYGAKPHRITIETDIFAGLPGISLVGLPTKSVEESRERLRSAIRNSGLEFPMRKIVLNLAPADTAKHGTGFELAMAIGILIASKQIQPQPDSTLFAAELSLDGSLRPARDSIASIISAQKIDCKTLIIARDTPAIPDTITREVEVIRVQNLHELYRWLINEAPQPCHPEPPYIVDKKTSLVDFSVIKGLEVPKRALEIAAAGNHNALLIGPPGSGKTLLAHAFPSILPHMETQEYAEVAYLHGIHNPDADHIQDRPIRSPHHTASDVALVGGGQIPKPGEVTLAHRGVLFLDELPEFRRSVLEALRQPIEDGVVHITRAQAALTYPAKFILLAAMNPCPCGYHGSIHQSCDCSPSSMSRYQNRISGPLLDRFDMHCFINEPSITNPLEHVSEPVQSKTIRERVLSARATQAQRFNGTTYITNSDIPAQELSKYCSASDKAHALLDTALHNHHLSQRGAARALKIARTIADLDTSPSIEVAHLSEALQFRNGLSQDRIRDTSSFSDALTR
ncbi:MAG: magnesium chelatase family protein [Patescibacteria group bacterium]|nr:magnesium chelatase family protein [Patescibacteria group bacterium]